MKIKWQTILHKTRASLLFQWYVFVGHSKKYFQESLDINIGQENQKIVFGDISIDIDEWMKLEKVFSHRIANDRSYLKKYIELCYKYSNELITVSKKINKVSESKKFDNKKLLYFYTQYQAAVIQLAPFLNSVLILDGILRKEISKLLLNDLKIIKDEKQNVLLSELIIPKKKSFFVQEIEALEKIALRIKNNPKANIKTDINLFLNKFAWMPSIAYIGEFQTEDSVLKRVKELAKEDLEDKFNQTRKLKEETKKNYNLAFSRIGGSKKLVEYIDLARECLYLVTYRLDVFFMVYFYVYPMFREIGERLNLNPDQVVFLTGDEIINSLEGSQQVDKKEIVERTKGYLLIKIGRNIKIQTKGRIKTKPTSQLHKTSVNGVVANRGRAEGKARIIMGVEDMGKVKSGDILISPMTELQYVPVMSRVSGIITDFGGMLCHAAIVSREFGIPCLVGTKNATKVFKDGDLVELNAYEGIARKL